MTMKRFALKYFPDNLLKIARTFHYRKALKDYSMESEPDLHACQKILKPGETVLDVGANIGVYTRFLSEFVGQTGHVVALEPVPETYSYLTNNVRGLGLANVECLNVAASDHDSDSDRMSIPEYSTGGSNLYEAKLSLDGKIAVRAAKLDTLFPNLNPVFIKCDVEGHEIECIEGALNLIHRCHPTWMVEVNKRETFELFRSLGYDAFFFAAGEFFPHDPAQQSVNYFFFPMTRISGSIAPILGGFGLAPPL